MALDIAALKAKLAAQKAATTPASTSSAPITTIEIKQDTPNETSVVDNTTSVVSTDISGAVSILVDNIPATVTEAPVVSFSTTDTLGTAKTSEIDHLEFLSKMTRLQESIHTKHPTMPVLLMQIHKQLRADPELVTTLSEDAIGVIVSGLQIHTKTELVSVVLKESKSKAKKIPVSVDMF